MSLGAALVGIAILRAPPIRIGGRAARVGEAREESAYALGGAPVSFPLAAGTRTLRLLVNFDLPATPSTAIPALQVRVRIGPDGRDEVFSLMPREEEAGRAFYLDSAKRPSRTALLGIERERDGGGALEVSLVEPRTSGVVRLLNLERRALATAEPAWVNLPAAAGASRRRVYFDRVEAADIAARALTVASEPGVGTWLEPESVAAWTLTGPATVTLSVEEGEVRGVVRMLTSGGKETEKPLALSAGRGEALALGSGLTTLRLVTSVRARVTLSGPPSAAGAFNRAVALSDGRVELRARPAIVEAMRCGPDDAGPLVTWALAGRRADQPLKIDARPVVAAPSEASVVNLRWRALDDSRHILAEGTVVAPARIAAEDRIAASAARLSEPTTFFVWPTVGATMLAVTCDRAADVTGASPAWLDVRDVEGSGDEERRALGLDATVRLRHAMPPTRRRYFGVAPTNRGVLADAGRVERLALVPRLERVAPPVSMAAHALTPVGQPPRVEMLVPDRSSARVATQVWSVPVAHETSFTSTGGTVSVVYAAESRDAAGVLRVVLDGRAVAEGPLYAARGQLTFAAPPGERRLRVDAPASARAFVNKPVPGASLFRRVALYSVPRGTPVHLRVGKSTPRHVVGVVLYGRGTVSREAGVAFEIDRGVRVQGGRLSRGRTALARREALTTTPVSSVVLLNTDVEPTWVSQPIFVTMGDDLGAGAHDVAVSVKGVSGVVFVRAFGHALDDGEGEATAVAGPLAWDLGT